MSDLARWKGLGELVVDAVEHGSRAIERIQLQTAARPFAIIEQIPLIAPAARVAHVAHTVAVTSVHGIVRLVARTLGTVIDVAGGDSRRPGPGFPDSQRERRAEARTIGGR
jgi:hypothetical protein